MCAQLAQGQCHIVLEQMFTIIPADSPQNSLYKLAASTLTHKTTHDHAMDNGHIRSLYLYWQCEDVHGWIIL